MSFTATVLSILLLPTIAFAQAPSLRCDSSRSMLDDCISFTRIKPAQEVAVGASATTGANLLDLSVVLGKSFKTTAVGAKTNDLNISASMLVALKPMRKQGFHWKRALLESFVFLSIEQAYVVKDDLQWVRAENGVPFNHYWRDYKHSLSTWVHSGWDDGDGFLCSYVGHPMQGALTGYIQVQNDPQGNKLEFSNTKAYWRSRIKAMLWSAAYSTQWNIGPLSELTVEKYGTVRRDKWNQNGTWPCSSRHCVTGVGQVDLVTTPVGGLGWMVMEDLLDKHVARRVESATRNRFMVDVTRCALNPIRGGANILHGKRPWYRASRDARE